MKAAQESNAHEYVIADNAQRDLEKQLRQKDWELEDVKAMNAARLFHIVCMSGCFTCGGRVRSVFAAWCVT